MEKDGSNWQKPFTFNNWKPSLAASAQDFKFTAHRKSPTIPSASNSSSTGLLSPNAKDPSDVAAAQARGAAPPPLEPEAQARVLARLESKTSSSSCERKWKAKYRRFLDFFFFF